MRARFLTSMVLAVAVAFAATPAGAAGRDSGEGGAFIPPDGDPTATARDEQVSEGGGGGGSVSDCHWEVAIGDDFFTSVYDLDTGERIHSETGRWLRRVCDGAAVTVNGQSLVPEGSVVNPRALAVQAQASTDIPLPPVAMSPDASRKLYVQVPTWLWLDEGWWTTYEATAVAGRVSSTVTARPVSVAWSMGDGNSVPCTGPGTPWTPGTSATSSCSHTYRTSSAGQPAGTFSVQATVTFEVTWSANTGAGGTLPNITRSSSVDVVVGEIQVINSR